MKTEGLIRVAWWLLYLGLGNVQNVKAEASASWLMPDRISLGTTFRQVSGGYNGFKVDTIMPVWDIRAINKWREDLDFYVRLQLIRGTVEAQHSILNGEGSGTFASLGVGLNYFPFETRAIGFDVGVEVFEAEFVMRGGLGPIRQMTADSF